jgi:hypothetical protein
MESAQFQSTGWCWSPFWLWRADTIAAVFTVRTIYLEQPRQETATYDAAGSDEEGRQVCAMLSEFLAGRPPEFREKLPFLKHDLELEWTAAPGRVALASFHDGEAPRTMGILLAGVDAEADRVMLDAWRENVLRPLLGGDTHGFGDVAERPVLINIVLPGAPELIQALQLVGAALASAYFDCVETQAG